MQRPQRATQVLRKLCVAEAMAVAVGGQLMCHQEDMTAGLLRRVRQQRAPPRCPTTAHAPTRRRTVVTRPVCVARLVFGSLWTRPKTSRFPLTARYGFGHAEPHANNLLPHAAPPKRVCQYTLRCKWCREQPTPAFSVQHHPHHRHRPTAHCSFHADPLPEQGVTLGDPRRPSAPRTHDTLARACLRLQF